MGCGMARVQYGVNGLRLLAACVAVASWALCLLRSDGARQLMPRYGVMNLHVLMRPSWSPVCKWVSICVKLTDAEGRRPRVLGSLYLGYRLQVRS